MPIRDPLRRKESKRLWYLKNRKRISEQKKVKYAANPKAARKRARRRYKEKRDECLIAMAKYHTNHPEIRKNSHWRARLKKYGLTPEDYEIISKAQRRKCPICGIAAKKNKNGNLHVDHCHKTGRVRGLLCFHCNAVLGHARDKAEVLRRAIIYLDNAKKKLDKDKE